MKTLCFKEDIKLCLRSCEILPADTTSCSRNIKTTRREFCSFDIVHVVEYRILILANKNGCKFSGKLFIWATFLLQAPLYFEL